jgi:hypothetical protein
MNEKTVKFTTDSIDVNKSLSIDLQKDSESKSTSIAFKNIEDGKQFIVSLDSKGVDMLIKSLTKFQSIYPNLQVYQPAEG